MRYVVLIVFFLGINLNSLGNSLFDKIDSNKLPTKKQFLMYSGASLVLFALYNKITFDWGAAKGDIVYQNSKKSVLPKQFYDDEKCSYSINTQDLHAGIINKKRNNLKISWATGLSGTALAILGYLLKN